jgi:hypothetical protein
MSDIKQRVITNYSPLIKAFVADVAGQPAEELRKIPMPFLPLYGDLYEHSPLRLAIIGMETRGWGNTQMFVEGAIKNAELMALSERESFRNLDFTGWGNHFGNSFWDVVMYFIASIHGIQNWKTLKRKEHSDVLSSIAWGNANAIEGYRVTAARKGASTSAWDIVKKASLRFDSGQLFLDTLAPDVILLMTKGTNPEQYFGHTVKLVKWRNFPESDMTVYNLPTSNAWLFHMPHPTKMRFSRQLRKELYCDQMLDVLCEIGLLSRLPQPGFNLTASIRERASMSDMNKYAFIGWVAHELQTRHRTMTARELAYLMNDCGFTTDRGHLFVGNTRGPYTVLRAAYRRAVKDGDRKTAQRIAEAFVNLAGKPAWC